jgi:hypothetical protein
MSLQELTNKALNRINQIYREKTQSSIMSNIIKQKSSNMDIITIKPIFDQYFLTDVLSILKEKLDELYFEDYISQFDQNRNLSCALCCKYDFPTYKTTFQLEETDDIRELNGQKGLYEPYKSMFKWKYYNKYESCRLYEYYYNPHNWFFRDWFSDDPKNKYHLGLWTNEFKKIIKKDYVISSSDNN